MSQVRTEWLRQRRDPLRRPPWNQTWKVNPITHEEIQQALQDPALDEQAQPWARNCRHWTREEASSRKNHVYRIAYFVKHRTHATPVTLMDGKVHDGFHRLAAAIYCGDEFISIEGD
jgi:hypothetical protein